MQIKQWMSIHYSLWKRGNLIMASILVESMKRLYQGGKITKENVSARVKSGKITEDEYEYIVGEKYK